MSYSNDEYVAYKELHDAMPFVEATRSNIRLIMKQLDDLKFYRENLSPKDITRILSKIETEVIYLSLRIQDGKI